MSKFSCVPGDNQLVDHIIRELKSKGIFDQFRKECIADVDTKPAYQNLRLRVEGSVSSFLARQKWKPDLNKNQLREKLRKHINEANYLEQGVERIVDQVVNPKVASVFIPQVEDLVYSYLGLQKPKSSENSYDVQTYTTDDSIPLPAESKALSPEASKIEVEENTDCKDVEMKVEDTVKLEKEEIDSPKVEGIQLTLAEVDSPESNNSFRKEDFKEELIVTTELSNLSIDIPLPDGPPKTEIQEETMDYKNSDTETSLDSVIMRNVSPLTPIRSFNNENSCDAQPSFDERKSDVESVDKDKTTETPISNFRFTIEKDCGESKSSANKILNVERSYQYDQNSGNNFSAQSCDDSSSSNNLHIDYQSDKDGTTTDSRQEQDVKMKTYEESKESKSGDEKKKSHKSSHGSKDSHRHSSSKHHKSKHSDDKNRSDKKSSKDDSSHKSRHSSQDKSKDRSDRDKKEQNEKSDRDKKDVSEKKDREKSDAKEHHSSSNRSSNSNKDHKSRHHSSSSSRHHSSSSARDEKKSSSSHSDGKKDDKNRHHSNSKSSRDHSRNSSRHRSDKDKNKSSSSKDKENRDKDPKKDEKKDKKVNDDHYSSSGRGNRTRRSTDRDSNDGNSSSSKGSTLNSGLKSTKSTTDHKSSSSKSDNQTNGGDSSSQSDCVENVSKLESITEKTDVVSEKNDSESNKSLKPVLKLENQLNTPIAEATPIKISKVTMKKPMFASNMTEAKELMKIRKQIALEEQRKHQEAALLIEFQEKSHSSMSQAYSGISGPELEFACFAKDSSTADQGPSIEDNNTSSMNESCAKVDISNIESEKIPTKVEIKSIEDSEKKLDSQEDDDYLNFVYGDPNKDLDLQYFTNREINTTETEKETFEKVFKLLENFEFTKTAFLLNCDKSHEILIKDCYKELKLDYKVVNMINSKPKTIPKKINTQDLAKDEIILPVAQDSLTREDEESFGYFNLNISTDSMGSSADYEKELTESMQTKSRQEVMEIILGGMATEFTCEPEVVQVNGEDTKQVNLKRKFDSVDESTDNASQKVLTPKKTRTGSPSEEISSTTDAGEAEKPAESFQSRFIGKLRRVGLPRPKNSVKVAVSPSSDQSLENYVQNSQTEKTKTKINGVANKIIAKKNKLAQRYNTSDLYKPKLHFLSKRHVT